MPSGVYKRLEYLKSAKENFRACNCGKSSLLPALFYLFRVKNIYREAQTHALTVRKKKNSSHVNLRINYCTFFLLLLSIGSLTWEEIYVFFCYSFEWKIYFLYAQKFSFLQFKILKSCAKIFLCEGKKRSLLRCCTCFCIVMLDKLPLLNVWMRSILSISLSHSLSHD